MLGYPVNYDASDSHPVGAVVTPDLRRKCPCLTMFLPPSV
jgi:hypothetical protein